MTDKLITTHLQNHLSQLIDYVNSNYDMPLDKLLPLFFQLKDKPYSLEWSHFMFEPMFRFKNAPRKMLYITGRQVSKSSSLAASQVLRAALIRNYNLLTVMPFFEQVRKFSTNYVRPFIMTSPLRVMLTGNGDSVLQRSLSNNSNLFYSYSQGDPSRLRGVPADECDLDEIQDMDYEDLAIIEANMSASRFKFMRFTGTPKTFDNTIHLLWDLSSQAVWHIPCQETGCKHLNRACADGDLLKMIGEHTLICSACGKPVNSRLGNYIHDFPARRRSFSGYRVSQLILPMHYESPKDWKVILDFRKEKPKYAFYNEILGESFDAGAKLLTAEELRSACTGPIIESPGQVNHDRYIMLAQGVDWGGRGKEKTSDSEDFISNTAVAIAGMRPDGVIEIPWLYKMPYELKHFEETRMVAQIAADARVDWLAMDYGGQGNVMEELVKAAGWPENRICPFTYVKPSRNAPIIKYTPPKHFGVRSSYMLEKSRSLILLCELIKTKQVIFSAKDEYFNDHLKDFFAIYEEYVENPRAAPMRLVRRMSRRTDDMVHACNFAVMCIYHALGRWPSIASAFQATGSDSTDET
jgi:hypothetical protein